MRALVKSVSLLKLMALCLALAVLHESLLQPVAEAKDKGRDIIIYNGKIILKGGKKKGNIIISNGAEHYAGPAMYKQKKKNNYLNYGGFWRRRK